MSEKPDCGCYCSGDSIAPDAEECLYPAAVARIAELTATEDKLWRQLDNALKVLDAPVGCAYCDIRLPVSVWNVTEARVLIKEHVAICPGHPLRQLEAKAAKYDAGVAVIREKLQDASSGDDYPIVVSSLRFALRALDVEPQEEP